MTDENPNPHIIENETGTENNISMRLHM